MTPSPLRLRQVCLVARDLEPVVDDLCAVFGVAVCHRDPNLAQFGLHNALMPFGDRFIEVVAPVRAGTTAGRYLERRGGDGGYMAIFDTARLAGWREHVEANGIRVAAAFLIGDYESIQLHPRDLGGTLVEINSTRGGERLDGPYGPAGPHWRDAVNTEHVTGLAGVTIQADDPGELAARWGRVLHAAPVGAASADGTSSLVVDSTTLAFTAIADGRGEGLAAVSVLAHDPPALLAIARARGLPADAATLTIGGVRFRPVTGAAS